MVTEDGEIAVYTCLRSKDGDFDRQKMKLRPQYFKTPRSGLSAYLLEFCMLPLDSCNLLRFDQLQSQERVQVLYYVDRTIIFDIIFAAFVEVSETDQLCRLILFYWQIET